MKIEDQIIFEDNQVIVLIKPQGVLSQGDETGDENLVDLLKDYVKRKYNKQGNAFIGLVHRLDRPTGGLMVFAKTSKAASRLVEQMGTDDFEKCYLACLVGAPKEDSATLVNYLEKDEKTNTVKCLNYPSASAKKAELSYEILEKNDKLALAKVKLETGRSHQIRVQFANIGCPLFGDSRYGGDIVKGWDLALWAYSLKFIHPTTKDSMVFRCEPPMDSLPWKNFKIKI